MKSIPLAEQETTINIFRTDDYCEIYTCDSTMITKLDKLLKRDPQHVTMTQPDEYGRKYKMPKSYIGLRPSRTIGKSEASKAASSPTE